jgi:hypothetical protein
MLLSDRDTVPVGYSGGNGYQVRIGSEQRQVLCVPMGHLAPLFAPSPQIGPSELALTQYTAGRKLKPPSN